MREAKKEYARVAGVPHVARYSDDDFDSEGTASPVNLPHHSAVEVSP